MNTLYSASIIKSINDSVMVMVDGKYKGQSMPVTDLKALIMQDGDVAVWTRKVLSSGMVVEKSMLFRKDLLIDFVESNLSERVLSQLSNKDMISCLRR